jgi:malonyl-CoA/methylmalonyl-CoA synthetase
MNRNLFVALTAADPGAVAIRTPDGRSLTYGDIVARTARLAQRLVDAGVKPGDRVAAQVEKSVEALLLYLACLRAGAVYLPLNTGYTPAELGYFLGDAEPSLLVMAAENADVAATLAGEANAALLTLSADGLSGTLVDGLDALPAAFDTVARGDDDLAAILYTSGTTGRSKGAMLSHRNLRSNAATLVESWRFTPADVLLHALPIYHTHGLFVASNVTFLSGASMILLPRFDPDLVFAMLPAATVLMGVPTHYTRLLADPRLTVAATANMRLFVSGSAPLLPDTHRDWEVNTHHRILERYGMTETNMNTSNPYVGDRRAGTVGLALPGVSVRVVEETSGAALPAGEIGMIEVRGDNVFQGYWRMPEKTAAEFRADGFFITGDLGRIDADGYVEIVGRGKDLVITGGLNVYPKEVETEIDAIDGVDESAIIGLPHADLGEAVTAIVRLKPGAVLTEADILATLGVRLARFKLPKRIVFVAELPRNAMGKVQKARLRDAFQE